MSNVQYTEEELQKYFNDPSARRARENGRNGREPERGLRGYFRRRFEDRKKGEAAYAITLLAGAVVAVVLILGIWSLLLIPSLPTFQQLDNPELQLATVAYTADNHELARYAFQNRSWVTYDQISEHAVNALVATEDHRFYDHWGVDFIGIMAAAFDAVTTGDLRGASTISQQLARNLYNQEIGFAVTPSRKLKEALTAIQLERRYTKREIIEMYLNTVEFGYNAFGIEAASKTFFNKPAKELSPLEGATLVGMLKAITYYNPARNPENAKTRRNQVLYLMMENGFISREFYEAHRDDPVETDVNRSSEITASFAPYFAEQVRHWMNDWAEENGYSLYSDGLRVYTTLDSELQTLATEAVNKEMEGLQAVVDYEWSRPGAGVPSQDPAWYVGKTEDPFGYFWNSKRELVESFIKNTDRYRSLRKQGSSPSQALGQLWGNDEFIDSLRTAKTRLEAGLVAMDPHNGHIKAWVGGRDLSVDWYDHVNTAARQPGSTFKPFIYTAAIDNGWSPYTTLPDSTYTYRIPGTNQVWRPGNFDNDASGQMMTLKDALAQSKNTVTARVITQLINPSQAAFYARRMGIESPLDEVPALALGVSDVTLLEMATAYSTLASGGLHYDPVFVMRIEDRFGNILYEHQPSPEEALSEETAYTVVDMMKGVINSSAGTGSRIRWQYGLTDYDFAGKTGTTQNAADGWFMLMHPDLVVGSWVGFNDRRITFKSTFWGQGAHNALFLVGSFLKGVHESPNVDLSTKEFPKPEEFRPDYELPVPGDEARRPDGDRRVGW